MSNTALPPLPPPPPATAPPRQPNGSSDPEGALLKQVITLGTLIKTLLGSFGLLVSIGVYEINQLDNLRNQTGTLRETVARLEEKVGTATTMLTELNGKVQKVETATTQLRIDVTAAKSSQPKVP